MCNCGSSAVDKFDSYDSRPAFMGDMVGHSVEWPGDICGESADVSIGVATGEYVGIHGPMTG